MPMVYVTEKTLDLIKKIMKYHRENTSAPSRIIKADVIHTALEEYAKRIGVKVE